MARKVQEPLFVMPVKKSRSKIQNVQFMVALQNDIKHSAWSGLKPDSDQSGLFQS